MNELGALREVADQVAVAEDTLDDLKAERDRLIVAALDAGAPALQVQIATGLSAARLAQIRRAQRKITV